MFLKNKHKSITTCLLCAIIHLVVASSASFVYAPIKSMSARKLICFTAPPLPKKSADFSGTPKLCHCALRERSASLTLRLLRNRKGLCPSQQVAT